MNRRRRDALAGGFGTLAATANSADERARAARYIATHAAGGDDARLLLEALGLATTTTTTQGEGR